MATQDIERLQRLAVAGDHAALQALIREAKRADNAALLPLELLRFDSREAFDIGCTYPIQTYPQHMQGIAVPLACVLYRWEAGFKTLRLGAARLMGFIPNHRNSKALIYVSTSRTANNGTAVGGFRLQIWEHTATNIQIDMCVNNQSCKQAKTAYASASREDAIASIVDFYKAIAFTRGILPAQLRRGYGRAYYVRIPQTVAEEIKCPQWAAKL